MRSYQNLAWGVLVLLSITGCKKDGATTPDTTDTKTTTSVSYYATGSNQTNIATNATGGELKTNAVVSVQGVSFTAASIYVDEITFEGKTTTTVSQVASIKKKVDILSGTGLTGDLDLPVGQYSDVKISLHLKKSANSDLAFNLSGTFSSFTKGNVPISIANSDEFQVKLNTNNIDIKPNTQYKVIVNYDLSKLLNGILSVELDKAQHTTLDDVLLISSSVNVDLYNKVKANWQTLATATIQ